MKTLSVLMLLGSLFTISNSCADVINMSCIGEIPSTVFLVETKSGRVNLTLSHKFGAAYAPFWSSLVVPNDIPMLSEKAEIVKEIGKELQFSFDVNDCKNFGKGLFQCFGPSEERVYGGHKVSAWGLLNGRVTEESMGQSFIKEEMTLATAVDEKTTYFTMLYRPGECYETR